LPAGSTVTTPIKQHMTRKNEMPIRFYLLSPKPILTGKITANQRMYYTPITIKAVGISALDLLPPMMTSKLTVLQ